MAYPCRKGNRECDACGGCDTAWKIECDKKQCRIYESDEYYNPEELLICEDCVDDYKEENTPKINCDICNGTIDEQEDRWKFGKMFYCESCKEESKETA